MLFYADFALQSEKFKQDSLAKAHRDELSAECFFNGKKKRVLQGDLNSFPLCVCEPGFVGENCEYTSQMLSSWMARLAELLKGVRAEVESITMQKRVVILADLTFLSYLPLGLQEVNSIFDIVKRYLLNDPFLENQKTLYTILDLTLMNCLRLLDLEKQSMFRKAAYEVEAVRRKKEIFELIQEIVRKIEECIEDLGFSGSFLEEGDSKDLPTSAFKIREVRMAQLPPSGLAIENPTIDRDWGISGSIVVSPGFLTDFELGKSPMNLQVFAFSLSLFRNTLPESDSVMTMMLYLKYVNPESPHSSISNKEAGLEKLRITFPIIFLPAFESVEKSVVCRAYTFDSRKTMVQGNLLAFDGDKETVECEYHLFFEPRNFYFAAAALKEQI